MKRYKLMPTFGANSFYGKAVVTEYGNNLSVLTSYKTDVCRVQNGEFFRMWDGYSATTMRHINQFRHNFGLPIISKKEWLSIPIL